MIEIPIPADQSEEPVPGDEAKTVVLQACIGDRLVVAVEVGGGQIARTDEDVHRLPGCGDDVELLSGDLAEVELQLVGSQPRRAGGARRQDDVGLDRSVLDQVLGLRPGRDGCREQAQHSQSRQQEEGGSEGRKVDGGHV